ncbi:MAG: diacylglycerol kinase family protein [Clostridium fessum]
MKKMLFIINPRSGKEQIRSRLLEILDSFVKAGYGPSVYITQGPKDAEYQAARAKTKELVVCSGGDGTLNEVVSGLMTITPEKAPRVRIYPVRVPRMISHPVWDFRKICGKRRRQSALGKPFLVDVGVFGKNRYFVYVAAFGAFTEVSYSTPQETKNILGHQAYMLEAIKRLTET